MLEAVGEGVSRAGHGQGLETVGEHEGEARGATKGGAVGILTQPLRGRGTPYTHNDAVRQVASLNYSVDFRSHSM